MAKIGYMEGTDPELLDKLALKGHELIPLGDESDGYAKNLFHLTRLDRIDLVLTRFYKLTQLSGSYGVSESIGEILTRCRETDTAVFVTTPAELEGVIENTLKDKCIKETVKPVTPGKLFEEIVSYLERKNRTEELVEL